MNRKIDDKNIRKLAKSGKTSLVVTIPRDFIVELGLLLRSHLRYNFGRQRINGRTREREVGGGGQKAK